MAGRNIPSRYMQEDRQASIRAETISKGAWVDLYVDLHRQTHGEGSEPATIIADAEKRLGILKAAGIR